MWAALALLSVAAPTPLSPQTLALIPSVERGASGGVVAGEVEADLLRLIAERPTLASGPSASEELRATIAACGASVPCMAAHLRSAGYALGLRLAVDQRFDPPVFTAQLVDAASSRALAELAGDAISGVELRAGVRDRVAGMLAAAGHPRLGRVEIQVATAGARVALEPPAEHDAGAGVFWASPGPRVVRASRGERVAEGRLEVVAGRTSVLKLDLEEAPGPELSAWMWPALGVLVAGAVISAVAVASSGGVECYCLAAAGMSCPPCP